MCGFSFLLQFQCGWKAKEPGQEYHRIIEWFGLEVTFKGHLVQPSCNEQEHLQLHEATQKIYVRR